MAYAHDDRIRLLEALDLSFQRDGARVTVDWFRAIYSQDLPNYAWHKHRNMELHFVTEGCVTFCLPDAEYDVSAGHGIAIPADVMHKLENRTDEPYFRYILKPTVELSGDEPEAGFLAGALSGGEARTFPIYGLIASQLDACMDEAIQRAAGFVTVIECGVMTILMAVARILTGSTKADYLVREKINTDKQRMQRITALLEQSCETLTVNDVAASLFLSTRQAQRVVLEQSGMTIRQLIMGARLKKAKELLKDPEMKLADVAAAMGFSSEQSFNRFFRNSEGEPPAHYRNSALAGNSPELPKNEEIVDDKELLQ